MDFFIAAILSVVWFLVGWRLRPIWEHHKWERNSIEYLGIASENHPVISSQEYPRPTVRVLSDEG